ncbi:unnamed protein product, partial [Didymodactylos carnosus]
MTYYSNATDDTVFSLEEIREELARCGYDGVSKQTLHKFQTELANLANHDKAQFDQEKSHKRNVQSNVDFTINSVNKQTQSDNESNDNNENDESRDKTNLRSIIPQPSILKTKQHSMNNVDDNDDNYSQSSERVIRRKVLRSINGGYLNNSLFSNSSSNNPKHMYNVKNDNDDSHSDSSDQTRSSSNSVHAIKSFIRPSSSASSLRRANSSSNNNIDSVQLYSYYKRQWQSQRAPGEKSHQSLRWSVRDQLLQRHDVPVKRKTPRRVNDYVVPTEKKRSSLRWEVR